VNRHSCFGAAAACLLAAAAPALSQTPSVVNGTLESRVVTETLEREISAISARVQGSAWIGYVVPVADRQRQMGCWSDDGPATRARVGPLQLEGADSMYVLVRIADRRIEKIRVASPECPLDIGGLTLHWLTGVRPPESVAWLESVAVSNTRRLSGAAVMALALHSDPQAADRLIALARSGPGRDVRSSAVFWVALRAGDKAFGTISEAVDDPDSEIRKRAVFALSQLPKDEGVPKLIELARTHRDNAVRRQAMFWLGQSGDPRALAFFEQVLKQ
jgi:hypothetical protein